MAVDKPCAEVVELGTDDEEDDDVGKTGSEEVQKTTRLLTMMEVEDKNEDSGEKGGDEVTITGENVRVVPNVQQAQGQVRFFFHNAHWISSMLNKYDNWVC